MITDHRAPDKPATKGRWSWAFMRRDGRWTRNRFLIGAPGNPMMARWRLIQTPLFGVYLHFVYREDLDPTPHDHPWRFLSIVLRGGYVEQFWPDARLVGAVEPRWREWGRPAWADKARRVHRFPLAAAHRIIAVRPSTVTLVVVGPKSRTWGFYTRGGVDGGRFVEWDVALGLRPTEGVVSTGKYLAPT